jgi:hypothetical protein
LNLLLLLELTGFIRENSMFLCFVCIAFMPITDTLALQDLTKRFCPAAPAYSLPPAAADLPDRPEKQQSPAATDATG